MSTTMTVEGKPWELAQGTSDVLVRDDGTTLPMLHRRNCTVGGGTKEDWPSLVDSHVPEKIRERTIAILWEVEVEADREGKTREMLFCQRCMLQQTTVY